MHKKLKVIIPVLLLIAVAALTTWYLSRHSIPVMQPRGPVAYKERSLMVYALLLAVIVVLPTFALTIYIAVKYREENHTSKTKYRPNFDRSRLFESIWWGVPIIIIGILCVVAWQSAHSLDPYKPLASDKQPLTIQVISLDWKWLFIYPNQNIASVNLAEIPVGTPVKFQVTSDTIMNSFWVPQLSGQIYSMPGMITQIHMQADKPGDYFGTPANIAGKGFSRMNFTVRAASQKDFNTWLSQAAKSDKPLDASSYAELYKPSMSVPVTYYSPVSNTLYNKIVMKYMVPANDDTKITSSVPGINGMKT
ncbi:MAG: COX aromatic rich motif-containing protein [Candidatus Saccharimonadales bacterium]